MFSTEFHLSDSVYDFCKCVRHASLLIVYACPENHFIDCSSVHGTVVNVTVTILYILMSNCESNSATTLKSASVTRRTCKIQELNIKTNIERCVSCEHTFILLFLHTQTDAKESSYQTQGS